MGFLTYLIGVAISFVIVYQFIKHEAWYEIYDRETAIYYSLAAAFIWVISMWIIIPAIVVYYIKKLKDC